MDDNRLPDLPKILFAHRFASDRYAATLPCADGRIEITCITKGSFSVRQGDVSGNAAAGDMVCNFFGSPLQILAPSPHEHHTVCFYSPEGFSYLHKIPLIVRSQRTFQRCRRLIDETIRRGDQVLFLLPEIALTAQIINRLRRYFGDRVGVYHSRFSASQRAEVWNRTMTDDPNQQYQVLLGARSALFLPFRRLGLVIVDEEHDSSYKQYDPAPRYHGRDAAIYLAHLWKARTVLGSATPSIESYFNAQQGKYGFCEMKRRYGGLLMPEVLCADMKEETARLRRERGDLPGGGGQGLPADQPAGRRRRAPRAHHRSAPGRARYMAGRNPEMGSSRRTDVRRGRRDACGARSGRG